MKYFSCIILLFLNSFVWAQTIKNYVYNGITVKTEMSDHDRGTLIHYVASKESNLSVDELKANFLDFDNYINIFQYTKINKVIDTISNNKWKIYQEHNTPWPLNKSHVIFLTELQNTIKGFKLLTKSITYNYLNKKHRALPYVNTIYTVEKLPNNKTLLKIDSEFIPMENAPKWVLGIWFPKGPVKILENFEKGRN